jgi:hypothetical protein
MLSAAMFITMAGCSGSAESSGTSAETSVTAESAPVPSESVSGTDSVAPSETEAGTVAASETVADGGSGNTADATGAAGGKDEQGRYFTDNKYILNFVGKFSSLAPGMNLSFPDVQGYFFTDDDINQTDKGRIIHLGERCENDKVMVGFGYNMDDEDMWYASIEAPMNDTDDWFNKYYFALIASLNNNPIPIGDNMDEISEFMNTLYGALVSEGTDKAIQAGDYVYVFKKTTESTGLFAVDTTSFFNAFYKDSIDLTVLE